MAEAHESPRTEREGWSGFSAQVFEYGPVSIAVVDREGHIVRANREAERTLGLTRAELTGRTYNDPDWHITDYEGNPFLDEHLPVRQVLDSGRPVYGVRHAIEKPSGERTYLSVNAAPVEAGDGEITHVVCMVLDVTPQILVEEELRGREAKFRALFEQSLDAIWVTDYDGTVREVNDAWLEMFGYEREEAVGMNAIVAYADPADRDRFLRDIEGEGFVRNTARFRRKNGSVFDCERTVVALRDEAGTIVAFQGVGRDVTEQREAEAALRASEERFRAVFEASPIGIALVDSATQRFIQANHSFLKLVGYGESELYQLTTMDITHPDDRESERTAVAQRRSGETSTFVLEKRYVRKDGGIRQVVLYGEPVVLGSQGSMMAIGSVLDVTEERRAQRALGESEQKYRSLFEGSMEAISIVTPDGAILDANKAWLDLYGCTREELAGINVRDLYVKPEDRRAFLEAMARNGFVKGETWQRKLDGSVMLCERSVTPWKDRNGHAVAFQAILRDITGQRRMAQALKDSEEKYRSLFEQSREAISFVRPDGAVIDANQAWLDLYGYHKEELSSLNIAQLYAELSERDEFLRRMAADGFVRDEIWFRRRDGSFVLCERSATAWKDEHGDTVAFQAFVRDITEQRRMERELQAQAEQLRLLARRVQSAREDERTGIARELHDRIGQELTALKLDLAGIQDRSNKGRGPGSEELLEIGRLVDQAAADVRQISSELRPGVLDDVGLAGAIEWHVSELQRRTTIVFDLSLAEREVKLDDERRTALYRVFQELITNVVRHAAARTVRIGLERRDDHAVVLTVSDDGQGMDVGRADEPASLGIVGMRERLQPFGGSLSYESSPDGGTTAIAVMPAE